MPNKNKPSDAHRSERFDDSSRLRQRDFADEIQGRNKLQGDDQRNIRNQRRRAPQTGGAPGRPDSNGEND